LQAKIIPKAFRRLYGAGFKSLMIREPIDYDTSAIENILRCFARMFAIKSLAQAEEVINLQMRHKECQA
jgi:hypothetical protein